MEIVIKRKKNNKNSRITLVVDILTLYIIHGRTRRIEH